jgi:hypothetical protein
VHHRFAQPLQMQFLETGPAIDQRREIVERHKREGTVGWAILPELDGAHLAAEVALANGFDLEIARKLHRCPPRRLARVDRLNRCGARLMPHMAPILLGGDQNGFDPNRV